MGPQLNQKSNYATCRQDRPSKLRKHIFILASAFILLQLQWKRGHFEGNVNLIAIVVNFSIFERKWSHKLTEEFFLGFFYVLLVFLHTNSKNYFIWNICLFKTPSDKEKVWLITLSEASRGWSVPRYLEPVEHFLVDSFTNTNNWYRKSFSLLPQIPTIEE